jgi:hypothetical protein
MQPSRRATELLRAITNGQKIELEQQLAAAAGDCRSAVGLGPFERESFELLEACVQALQSHAVSSARGKAAAQILVHLAGTDEAEKLMLAPARGSYRSATIASSHH